MLSPMMDISLASEESWEHQREEILARKYAAIQKLADGAKLEGMEWSHATWWLPRECDPSEVPRLLLAYGYLVESPGKWSPATASQGDGPRLTLDVLGHSSVVNHTFYSIQCALAPGQGAAAPVLEWQAPRRLFQLRKGLHERVKERLGSAYAELFGPVHFVDRMQSVDATMGRLRDWLAAFAGLVNTRRVSPTVAAMLLEFLLAPPPEPCMGS